jgi:hypothetical protein
MDRLIFVGLYRLAPNTIKALTIVNAICCRTWATTTARALTYL